MLIIVCASACVFGVKAWGLGVFGVFGCVWVYGLGFRVFERGTKQAVKDVVRHTHNTIHWEASCSV